MPGYAVISGRGGAAQGLLGLSAPRPGDRLCGLSLRKKGDEAPEGKPRGLVSSGPWAFATHNRGARVA